VLTAIARYLDPHVDGDKQPLSAAELRALAQQGSLPLRLKAAWERGGGALAVAAALGAAPDRARPPPAFECRRELVLGVYVRHAVHKMNCTLGFGAHVPGVGRAPIGAVALQRHVKILAVSVLEAAQRDFNEGKPAVAVGSLVLSTELLEGLISEHLKAAFAAYDELNGALTLANKEGEDARKAERTRIWGHA
jgi:tRNA U55 pseudouridine synthase TruB